MSKEQNFFAQIGDCGSDIYIHIQFLIEVEAFTNDIRGVVDFKVLNKSLHTFWGERCLQAGRERYRRMELSYGENYKDGLESVDGILKTLFAIEKLVMETY